VTQRYDEGLGAMLRRYRLAAALTQEELAAASGLSVRTISGIEGGRTTRPYWRTARLLADALGLGDEDRAAVMSAARVGRSAPAAVGHAVGAGQASAAADEAKPSPTPRLNSRPSKPPGDCGGMSDRLNLLGLQSARATRRGVLHALVLLQAAVAVSLDG
jgi:transcriptional regulator with XRE-family HTH domain